MSEFNYYVYIISYIDNLGGPIKIGYSTHPPTRLKQLQTGNSRRLTIYGHLSFKNELAAKLVEKIILFFLKNNNVQQHGEWHNINVSLALNIFEFFPDYKEDLFKPTDIQDGKIINFTDLISYCYKENKINDDEYDYLSEIFYSGENEFKYLNFLEESKNSPAD